MTTAPAPEAITFRAEIRQLLNILIHSLYTDREIFLRELISNASDALNRLQFVMLTDHDVRDPDAELAIRISGDPENRTLTISDTGDGMTREEMIENLGTIAHSGAASFLQSLQEGQKLADVIGQFGVGFYSVFMVADEVKVTSLSRQPDATAWTWTAARRRQLLHRASRENRARHHDHGQAQGRSQGIQRVLPPARRHPQAFRLCIVPHLPGRRRRAGEPPRRPVAPAGRRDHRRGRQRFLQAAHPRLRPAPGARAPQHRRAGPNLCPAVRAS